VDQSERGKERNDRLNQQQTTGSSSRRRLERTDASNQMNHKRMLSGETGHLPITSQTEFNLTEPSKRQKRK
jgi:hypothetical protein